MSACEIPSLWKLWITLACVVASTGTRLDCVVVDCGLCRCLYRYSTGYRLAANTSRIMWWSDTSMQHFRALKNNGRAPRQQLDLPYRPRYIHRGSRRRFVVSKTGDHSSISSLWSALRPVAQLTCHRLRHQSTATPGIDSAGCNGALKNLEWIAGFSALSINWILELKWNLNCWMCSPCQTNLDLYTTTSWKRG